MDKRDHEKNQSEWDPGAARWNEYEEDEGRTMSS